MESQLKRAASSGGCGIAGMKRRALENAEDVKKKVRQLGKKVAWLVEWGSYMTKADLIEGLANRTRLSKTDAECAINVIFEGLTRALSVGDRVTISGFGTFGTTAREARTGRNPRTGDQIEISASKFVKFKSAKQLKELLNLVESK
jgi:DNA-binding protein HU-beta